jgi:hypothetical protein
MNKLWIIVLAILMVACSSHAIRCDGGLQPINAPVPAPTQAHKRAHVLPESRP